jgi:hypothetical protein
MKKLLILLFLLVISAGNNHLEDLSLYWKIILKIDLEDI